MTVPAYPFNAADAFAGLETPTALTEEQIDAKASALLAQLTLDEKLHVMDGDTRFWPGLAEMMQPGGYSSRVWVAGAVPRLGIPGVRFSDGPRGVIMEGATTFPVSMARGASWDVDLEERIGDVIGRELRAMGGNFFGGVCINLLRHPAWGRAQETYGEDSFHLGLFGAALTKGVQRHAMACVKHYALNSMENARFRVDVTIGPRALHEVYLAHFKRVIDAGVASVMSAYNSVNGEWAGQNEPLLSRILKRVWGFKGFVITDFIFGMRDTKKAARGGQDIEMPFAMLYDRDLKSLVERGDVPISRIDDAVLRILRQQVRFGQGRDPKSYGRDVIGCEEHRKIAREAARKSIVLLKNDNGILPLRGVRKVAVIGKLADTPNTGDGGSSNTRPAYVVTPLQGLRESDSNIEFVYDDGADPKRAADVARNADAAVLVVGYTHADEGEYIPGDMMQPFIPNFPKPRPEEEAVAAKVMGGTQEVGFPPGGDRAHLNLHQKDERLIQTVAAAQSRVVVAMMAGSAVIGEAWRASVPGILMLWYPGMEGGHALADILVGRVNPSGRLPCTFPAQESDLPFFDREATAITYDLWHGYRKFDRDGAKAAFPFGFGLSYTSFRLANLKLAKGQLGKTETLEATVDVSNTGAVEGDDVVQLYVSTKGSKVERAPKELKAFARVGLTPGETKTIRLSVPVSELAYYDEANGWIVEAGTYEAIAAHHAADAQAVRAGFSVS